MSKEENKNGVPNEGTQTLVDRMIAASDTVLLFLDTSEIAEPEITNVRPWSAMNADEEEIARIEALAATIEVEGQLQPVLVRKAVNGSEQAWELIAGRRRKKAIELLNAGREKGKELKIKAVVSANANENESAYRQAAIENLHRHQLNPMDVALDIQNVREKFKWGGSKGTKKVADFFKVSGAQITQYEKLLGLPVEVQKKVAGGEVSRDDAFRLAQIQKHEGEEAAKEVEKHASASAEAIKSTGGGKKQQAAAKSKVIKKAAKSAKAKATGKENSPRSKSEIIEFFEGMLGPAYGYADGDVHKFVNKFVEWCKGNAADSTLEKYWDVMVEKASKGTPGAKKQEVITAAKGKSVSRPANKK